MDLYKAFYVEGRTDIANEGVSAEVDITEIAKRVMNGEKMYDVTYSVSEAALKPNVSSGFKKRWLADHVDEIKAAGGDKERAFKEFFSGQCDEFRHLLEDEAADAMEEIIDGGREEDEGDGDDEEEEEEDDEEDDEPTDESKAH